MNKHDLMAFIVLLSFFYVVYATYVVAVGHG
jgi:hypothetical protein